MAARVLFRQVYNVQKIVCQVPIYLRCCKAEFASKLGSGAAAVTGQAVGGVTQKQLLPVETDPERLANYVCGSNIYKDGEDVKLKEDSEYPDWLWKLRLDPPPEATDLDPNTKEYWELLEHQQKIRSLRLQKSKMKKKKLVNQAAKLHQLKAVKHRALTYLYYDPGYEKPPKFDRDRTKMN